MVRSKAEMQAGCRPPFCVDFPCLTRKILAHPASSGYEYRF